MSGTKSVLRIWYHAGVISVYVGLIVGRTDPVPGATFVNISQVDLRGVVSTRVLILRSISVAVERPGPHPNHPGRAERSPSAGLGSIGL